MAVREYVYLSGKVKWAKGLLAPSQWKKYGCKLNLDNPSLSIVLDLKKKGIKNELTKDEDGYWINLSRPSEINIKGSMQGMLPPVVVTNDDPPIPWNQDKMIGDGSDITCKVAVRNWKSPFGVPGVSIRLESVRVDNLVEFTTDHWPEKEAKQIKGLAEAPKPAGYEF
jgi:hypothetical protein